MKDLRWRAILIAGVMLVAIVYLLPSLNASLPAWWKETLPNDKIHLGLDLQGGMHLVLEVQADEAVRTTVERLVDEMKDTLRSERIPFRTIKRTKGGDIQVELADAGALDSLRSLVEKQFPILDWVAAATEEGATTVLCRISEKEAARIRDLAVKQALETIRNRIDQFGVSEPDIRPQGEDRILVQLPGVKDPQRAIDLIGKTALLEFKLVAEGVDPNAKSLPPGVRVHPMKRFDPNTGRTFETKIALKDRTLMTGEYITNASVRIDTQYNTPYVALEFDPQGARLFERITGEHVKERLAIVLDGVVYSAPVIQEKIGGGRASITGSFSMEEARDLAIVLRAGALPAPVTILEERTVGPSLGADSIHQGFLSMVVGSVLILLFMAVYYRVSGVIANVALVLNVVLIMAALAAFRATLTLPGIAGIILTIGMAVDANVLIFERIREELRLGKTPRAAVDAGFARATLTILDANITTLIAAVVLFQFGTGPVKGFAVTLSIGIVASLFTAIIVSRLIFDYLLVQRRVRSISI
ncbi:preprotein translocase subunit SecD [Desulfacinum hydrothermale DSM 13146]|uniref:Protein translocase subunit SecD n=1 Tax=Desulfacinum hydrothermale DSM 13146 TaxID=1121390 RepID=A0A1W1X9T9_9BACT|nr:protein translocase subunit SecD [Desulfacinum hydrothermale]SMC20438.1 preprotein translocase subunit SecD [Desulfacinum hydrothermale DSM 13146]